MRITQFLKVAIVFSSILLFGCKTESTGPKWQTIPLDSGEFVLHDTIYAPDEAYVTEAQAYIDNGIQLAYLVTFTLPSGIDYTDWMDEIISYTAIDYHISLKKVSDNWYEYTNTYSNEYIRLEYSEQKKAFRLAYATTLDFEFIE